MSQTKSELEQCFYCREFYPKPVSLHHTIEECKENERNYWLTSFGSDDVGGLRSARRVIAQRLK